MYGYLPERIYNVVKDEQVWKDIDTLISNYKNNITNFKDMIVSDKNMPDVESSISKLEDLIKSKCPTYYNEYKVAMNEISKEDLLTLYNDTTNDNETKLFILSNVINQSYKDHLFEEHMRKYIEVYDAVDSTEKSSMSNYIHLKYFANSCFIKSLDTEVNDDYVKTVLEFIKTAKQTCSTYVSSDTLNNSYIEVIDDLIYTALYKIGDDSKVLTMIQGVDFEIDSLVFQYKNYSYSYVKYLDHWFNLYFATKNFPKAFEIFKKNLLYIDNSLVNIKTLLRGLNYYDKCSEARFLVVIRKYLKIIKKLNFMEIDFKHLQDVDRELALVDEMTTETETPSTVYYVIVKNYIKHVEDWLTGNDFNFHILNLRYDGKVTYDD